MPLRTRLSALCWPKLALEPRKAEVETLPLSAPWMELNWSNEDFQMHPEHTSGCSEDQGPLQELL